MNMLDEYDTNPDEAIPRWIDVLDREDYVAKHGDEPGVSIVLDIAETTTGRQFRVMTMESHYPSWVSDDEMLSTYTLAMKK